MSGILMMLAGCVVNHFVPFLGIATMGYGVRETLEAKGGRGFAVAIQCAIAISVLEFALGSMYALVTSSSLLCALGIAWCMRDHKATVLGVSLVVVLVALCNIGIQAVLLASSGSSLTEVVDQVLAVLTAQAQGSLGTGLEADLLIQQMMPLFRAVWPFVYVASAAVDALAAGVGSHLMYARVADSPRIPSLANFDMPVWVVGALATSILGFGVSLSGIPGADILLVVSATALMSVRLIFMLQGFGVAIGLSNRFRLGCLGRFAVVFLSVWLETMFVLSIVGLIDVWANFRKLQRNGSES
ncbi:MAG: DUF2232 domain-containing protein [Collinsella sp.]|nr:DUF2232 domain-containing protein [Collinsella sp.]